jgi:putative sterol carrier protein
MNLPFPSGAWIQELSRQLNESESYEKSAKNWEGDFLFVIGPEPKFPEGKYLYMDLFHGKSPTAGEVISADEKAAKYVLSAPFATWRKVIEGKLDPIQGMMNRQLKLKGDMMQIMRYPKAAKEIVSCCAKIPTDFGDA